jgi:hypothetical protein
LNGRVLLFAAKSFWDKRLAFGGEWMNGGAAKATGPREGEMAPLRQCRRHERADGEGGNVESENRSWPRKNTKPAGLILKGEGRSDFEVFTEITPPLRSLFFCGSAISEFGLNAFARKEPVFSRKCQPEAILRIIQKLEPARPAIWRLGSNDFLCAVSLVAQPAFWQGAGYNEGRLFDLSYFQEFNCL